jgi:hypothetical protein
MPIQINKLTGQVALVSNPTIKTSELVNDGLTADLNFAAGTGPVVIDKTDGSSQRVVSENAGVIGTEGVGV